MFKKIALAAVATLSLGAIALSASVGCGSSSISCSDVCSCSGTADQAGCTTSCQKNLDDGKAAATKAGCSSQADDFSSCVSSNSKCDSNLKTYVTTNGACDTETTAFVKCVAGGGTTGGTTSAAGGTTSSTGTGG